MRNATACASPASYSRSRSAVDSRSRRQLPQFPDGGDGEASERLSQVGDDADAADNDNRSSAEEVRRRLALLARYRCGPSCASRRA